MKRYFPLTQRVSEAMPRIRIRFVLKGLIYIIFIEDVRPNFKGRNFKRVFEANEKKFASEIMRMKKIISPFVIPRINLPCTAVSRISRDNPE